MATMNISVTDRMRAWVETQVSEGRYATASDCLRALVRERMEAEEKLAALREGYDLLILDTPPLLAASDAAILATLSDGVIMVLRAGSTETAAAQQAMQQLHSIGARVVGAVLNDPESHVARYGSYYTYNYASAKA